MSRRLAALVLALPALAHGGAFIFTEQEINGQVRPDMVTHPPGYGGNGGTVTVEVCIVPNRPVGTNPMASQMTVSVQNIIDRFNLGVPVSPNLGLGSNNELFSNQVDFESVALHELGHCQGLNHVNAATESGFSGSSQDYTKALPGSDGVFLLDNGSDNIIGSPDDQRGDDINLHYFEIGVNDPFRLPLIIDSSTYSRDLGELPGGDDFAANADRDVGRLIYGIGDTESVMQQLTFLDEAQRELTADDVATLRFAQSGVDRVAGTADDYQVVLEYGGVSSASSCDINVSFNDSQTGFAVCGTSAQIDLSNNAAFIGEADAYFSTNANWKFSTTRIPMPVRDRLFAARGEATTLTDLGADSLLVNDSHPNGTRLVATGQMPGSGPFHGTIDIDSDGRFTYQHDSAAGTGADQLVYEVCPSTNMRACSHQYVDVLISHRPLAPDHEIAVLEGGSYGPDLNLLSAAQDDDGDGTAITTGELSSAAGMIDIDADGTFAYQHDGSETGADSFSYEVCDDSEAAFCASGTVAVVISEVNDPVVAADDALADLAEDASAISISASTLTANDDAGEPDQSLSLVSVGNPTGGTVALQSGGAVFTPAAEYSGTAGFDYTVEDDGTTAGSNDPSSDTATVRFAITEVNDPPIAADDALETMSEDDPPFAIAISTLLNNDSTGPANEAGQNLNLIAVSNAIGGEVAIDGSSIVFTLAADFNGTAGFDYQVEDDGTTDGSFDPQSASASVRFEAKPLNDGPVAIDDTLIVVLGGTTQLLASGADSVLANDIELDGDALIVSVVSHPATGSLSLGSDGGFTFTDTQGMVAEDSFVYQACDDNEAALCSQATVAIRIVDDNHARCGPGGRRAVVGIPVSIDVAAALGGSEFAVSGLPGSLSIDADTGLISGIPFSEDLAGSPYAVSVSNAQGASEIFRLTIDGTVDTLHYGDFERACIGL